MLPLSRQAPGPKRHAALAALAACGSLLGACGGDATPAYVHLAASARLASPFTPRTWRPVASDATVHLGPAGDGEGYWLTSTLRADAWRPLGPENAWWTPRPFPGQGLFADREHQVLRGSNGRYAHTFTLPDSLDEVPAPGLFTAVDGQVLLLRPQGEGPPGDLELRELLVFESFDGVATRVAVGPVVADGVPLLSGSEEVVTSDLPADSVLSVWTTARADAWEVGAPEARVRFRIRLDGATLLEHELVLANGFATEHHVLPLPPAGREGARLTFALEGDPAIGAFHVPLVRPREVGRPDARPWDASRPDVVLLLLDTFRADNLATYGGDPRLTPHLDALAAESLAFLQARSNASWTLPAHATLLSGVLPYQAGCVANTDRLDDAAVSLAERLRAVGYRTVAVTDAGFVRRAHGLAQGFEWFLERQRRGADSFDEALADVLTQLDADDGRPLFLFFQTYRAHEPYEVTAETRAALGDALGLDGHWLDLIQELGLPALDGSHPHLDEFCARAEPLYRGGVHDLDRGVGHLVAALEERGHLSSGVLLVTSDHGEAFGEHGRWGHGSDVHEEQVRVPLLLRAPGLAPGEVEAPVSLVDVPTTLALLAGVAPDPSWLGTDLRAVADDPALAGRPQYAFVGDQPGDSVPEAMAAVQRTRKLLVPSVHAPSDGWSAYDLEADPGEAEPTTTPAWARTLAAETAAALPALTTPLFDGADAELSAEARRQLEELGYGGG